MQSEAKPGVEYVDVALSSLIRDRVQAADKECFMNSFEGLLRGEDVLPPGTVYVEGWVSMTDFPLVPVHAWLETPEGRIIEPTPVYLDNYTDRTYFAAFRYSPADIFQIINEAGDDAVYLPLNEDLQMECIPPEHYETFMAAHEMSWGAEATAMLRACHEGNARRARKLRA